MIFGPELTFSLRAASSLFSHPRPRIQLVPTNSVYDEVCINLDVHSRRKYEEKLLSWSPLGRHIGRI